MGQDPPRWVSRPAVGHIRMHLNTEIHASKKFMQVEFKRCAEVVGVVAAADPGTQFGHVGRWVNRKPLVKKLALRGRILLRAVVGEMKMRFARPRVPVLRPRSRVEEEHVAV